MICTCPLCGAPITELLPINALLAAPVSPLAARCVLVLSRLYPNTISTNDLASIVYQDDAHGGPENARLSLAVTFVVANKILKQCGWRIGASSPGKRDDIGLRPLN